MQLPSPLVDLLVVQLPSNAYLSALSISSIANAARRASCFVEKSITVRPGCIVKNVPEGIRVVEEEIKNY